MELVESLLASVGTPFGLALTGGIVAVLILIWDWRVALAGLIFVQIGVAAAAVTIEQIPLQWALVQIMVVALACLILALSALRTVDTPSQFHSGTWMLRLASLVLIFSAWRLLNSWVHLPEMDEQMTALVVWLGLAAFLILALGENPLFYAVALLLWIIPIQAVVAILLAVPALSVMIGMLELLLALACSYLLLAEYLPLIASSAVLADTVFPQQIPAQRKIVASGRPPRLNDGTPRDDKRSDGYAETPEEKVASDVDEQETNMSESSKVALKRRSSTPRRALFARRRP